MLLLALFLFPLAEKAGHDFEHFNDEHCGIKDTHFCEAEHTCSICDFVLSSASSLPQPPAEVCDRVQSVQLSDFTFLSHELSNSKFSFFLRGPPALA
jgi:hypothetical protein